MIQIQGKLDRKVYVACSGGIDSMAVVDFLSRNHCVQILFFDHGNQFAKEELEFLCDTFGRENLQIGNITQKKTNSESWEEYWRTQRYAWFHSLPVEVITCHHLDDCVETWVFTALHGEPKVIPYRNLNVYRPFLLNPKAEFTNWCRNKNVKWIEDPSNSDVRFMRNFIRHQIIPQAMVVNPGLPKTIRKLLLDPVV